MHHVTFPDLGLVFDINPTAFSIGDFSVQWYGVIIGFGFLLAIIYAAFSCKKMNIKEDALFDCVIVGLILGVIGARLYYVIFYPGDDYIKDPSKIFSIKEGGLGIYGGIIGGLLGGCIMAKIRKMKIASLLDIASLGFLIGQGIGRWGNFMNQEAFGSVTDLPWRMESANTIKVAGGAVHPCFLYESLLCLLGFAILHFFTRKMRRYDGQTFLLYVAWYGFIRFFIEGLRTDSLYIPGINLKVSQVVAAASVIAAVIIMIIFRRKTTLTGCGNKAVMELNGIKVNAKGEVIENTAEEITENATSENAEENTEDASDENVEVKSEETENSEENKEENIESKGE